jgi:hypothetical protein
MSAKHIDDKVQTAFGHWQLSEAHPDIAEESLSEFIWRWVECGKGVVACNGDFQTYLIAVICIIKEWHAGGYSHGSVSPSPDELFRKNSSVSGDPFGEILDQHWFEQCVFKTLHPDPAYDPD